MENNVLLVTGAAGRIGTSVVRLALAQGSHVIAADISSVALDSLVASVDFSLRPRLTTFVADITNLDHISDLIEKSVKALGRIDAVVHSAYPRSEKWGALFEDLQPEFLSKDLSCQLGSAILFSQAIYKQFCRQGGGSLVHVSSIQGVHAPKFDHYENTGMSSPIEYAAIKAGIISMTRWLAKYSANKNIRVNCVSPGGIIDAQPDNFIRRYRASCSNFGMLNAGQVASVILFLVSPEAEAINGQNLIVDDGWTL